MLRDDAPASALEGRAEGWRTLAGSAVGIAFGSVPFFTASFAIFASAWRQAFGWSDVAIARAATLFLLLQIVAAPVTGTLVDRQGSRIVGATSIAMFASGLIVLSLDRGSLPLLLAAFAFLGLTTAGTNVIAYARAIARHFTRRRGLSLGLAAAAQAVGIVLIPNVAQLVIERRGWADAIRLLAAVELLVCRPAVLALVSDRPGAAACAAPAGGLIATVVPSRAFLLLAGGGFMQGLTFYAILPNLGWIVARTAHLSPGAIAACTSIAGLAFLAGRLGSGALLDRISARGVGVAIAVLAMCSLLAFSMARGVAGDLVAGVLLGLAGGGETDLLPYAASRYFGVGLVSRAYGTLLVAFFAGAAAGPVAFAHAADRAGTGTALVGLAALQLVPAALLMALRPYPVLRESRTEDVVLGATGEA